MATAAEIRGQVYEANSLVEEAQVAVNHAKEKVANAIAMHHATDSSKLGEAISALKQADRELEAFMVATNASVESAAAYAQIV